MTDRATIADIFLELTGAQFNRAKGFLKDNDVPGGIVDEVKYADDMAQLILSHFKRNERKQLIREILTAVRAEDVKEKDKVKRFLNDEDDSAHSGQSRSTDASQIDVRKKLYHDLEGQLSLREEDQVRMLLGRQLTKRELEELKSFAHILIRLEEKGYFQEDFKLLKDVLKQLGGLHSSISLSSVNENWEINKVHTFKRFTARILIQKLPPWVDLYRRMLCR
ncbi:uncharacterized protein [Ptychodera flava]|uniref:uncharacterized protein n=1 Tax=Ptychodera flava TaxID=63121 RepID=UPI00396A0DED